MGGGCGAKKNPPLPSDIKNNNLDVYCAFVSLPTHPHRPPPSLSSNVCFWLHSSPCPDDSTAQWLGLGTVRNALEWLFVGFCLS